MKINFKNTILAMSSLFILNVSAPGFALEQFSERAGVQSHEPDHPRPPMIAPETNQSTQNTDTPATHQPYSDRELVVTSLVDSGVDVDEAQARVDSMTDSEVTKLLDSGIAELPAGQSDTITIGIGTAILIGILLLVL